MRLRESSIVAADGRPILIAQEAQAYRNAGLGRSLSQLHTSSASINTTLRGGLTTLRNRSRDLLRNSPTVWKAVRTRVAEIVGTGITPRSGWSDEATRAALHQLWSDSIDEMDADGRTDGYGLQKIVVWETLVAGECFARLRRRLPVDGLAVPLQVQLLSADQLPSWKNEDLGGGRRIRQGIEFDAIGRRVAYHFHRDHPGDYDARGLFELVRVPANEILHLYEVIEPGQVRGEPSLARIIRRAAMLDGGLDAVLQRFAIAALFAGFITEDADTGQSFAGEDAAGAVDWVPGMLQKLKPGESITFPTMPDAGGPALAEFVRVLQLDEAAGMDVTYEQLTGDLSRVNFSSIRAGLVAFRRQCEQYIYGTIVPAFCRPLWREWVTAAVASGAITLPGFETAVGRREAFRVDWSPQAWPWVDPQADVAADNEMITARTISRRAVIRKRGDDPDVVEAEILEEEAADRAAGRPLAGPAPKAPLAPAAQRFQMPAASRRSQEGAGA